jgi:alkyl hydroperoxide reductase subunit D
MPELTIPHLDQLKEAIPEPAKDLRINLGNVLNSEVLDATQTWGVALTSAYFVGEPRLREALVADARAAGVSEDVFQDAQAAAALMAMNTIFYRFRHMVGKDGYAKRPARLRMQWMTQPKTGKANFELYSLAVAALEGCEACIQAHEAGILKHGLTEEHVQEAVRIAAVLNGVAVALRI